MGLICSILFLLLSSFGNSILPDWSVNTGVSLPYLSVNTIPAWYRRNDLTDFFSQAPASKDEYIRSKRPLKLPIL